ncbi:MAG: hypothetical protein ACI915_003497 [Gammaproteobacteria bacterium]|jgi:hypothetical protein
MAIHTVSMAAELELASYSWRAINDGVMGGISRGEMVAINNGLRFRGQLSLENNGGFASARTVYDGKPLTAGGVRLRVRGDGRRYQFRVRLDAHYDGISWRASFNTNESWQIVNLPFGEFEPVYRGRLVTNAGSFEPEKIRQIGFMLAARKEGAFELDIASIEFSTGK